MSRANGNIRVHTQMVEQPSSKDVLVAWSDTV
jgi:hypothetical protein